MLSAETAELLADGVTADEEAIPAEGQKEHAWHAHLGLGWRADVSSRDSSWAVAGSYAERAARRAELGRARTTRSRGCQRRGRTTRSKPDAPRRQPCATCSPVGEPVGAVAAGAEMATAAAAAAAAATASTAAEVVEVERGRRRLRAGACRRGRGRPQRQRLARCGAPIWGMAWGVSTTCHGQVSIGKLRVVDSSLLWSLTPSAHSSKTLAPPLAPVTGEAIRPTTDAPRAPATDTFRPKSTSKVAASRHSRTHMRAIPFEPWLAIRVGRPR